MVLRDGQRRQMEAGEINAPASPHGRSDPWPETRPPMAIVNAQLDRSKLLRPSPPPNLPPLPLSTHTTHTEGHALRCGVTREPGHAAGKRRATWDIDEVEVGLCENRLRLLRRRWSKQDSCTIIRGM